jgi:hypothetical protein
MINYLAPSASSSLTYPIKQATVDLSSANFTALLNNPLIILPAVSTVSYVPINIITDFENINWSPTYTAYYDIINSGISLGTFDFTIYRTSGVSAVLSPLNFSPMSPNVRRNQPFQLTSTGDNAGISFSRFIVTVTYIEYTL